MPVITIDGIKIQVPKDSCVLEGALKAGVYIPHLCHHPDLPEHSSCRLCIVEVEGEDQVVTSCTLKPRDGMVIQTKSERINRLRSLALDLLLAGHPEDCSTCPKYGNCELQTLIQYLGGASSRMKHRVKGFRSIEDNPLLAHDMNRCVLCGRCVRACKDLRGVGILKYSTENMETYIGTLHDKLLKDEDCRFCQACAEVCPTGTIRDKRSPMEGDKTREEMIVPCRAFCPAHTDVPRYIYLVKEGRYEEAAAVIREKVPFPKVLGYICNHVCEMQCKRSEVNEAMSIREIKRYAAEADTGTFWRGKGKQLPLTGKKVCIAGAGPAGMTAAYYLRKQGHEVTVLEANSQAGGMLRYGIPEYRLPGNIIEEELQVMMDAGVKMECNKRVEDPIVLKEEYDAVLLAMGTHKGVRLPIEGSELKGVLVNTEFLKAATEKRESGMGKRVVVLGGGNVAFDCARTAKRLGAIEVHLACLESRENMPADEEEITQAMEEGILIHPGRTFERITGESQADGVEFMEVLTFAFDKNRRPVITKKENSKSCIQADTVIFAVGQRPELRKENGLPLTPGGYIEVDEKTLRTGIDGIFAAGDVIYGTRSVIEAIASGRKAAASIDRYLGGDGDISEILAPVTEREDFIGKIEGFGDKTRAKEQIVSADERVSSFQPYHGGICGEDICKEANRCLQCDLRLKITPPRLWGSFDREEEVR
ncbi:FAD-dependent oxidoreductase [Lacrimispora aerotolerans]|uniref:FAD-dependent oxidoreductase n=1 Tax=Lacrimispora aerotolerans TaxID=36832 RepID=UPI00047AA0F6|nr:FAD-dependent oxidoreductase [Lacrimispora aerotolerans]